MATNGYIKGLLVGGLVGAAVGILYAPKSGKELREGICCSADELLEKAKCQYEEAYRKLEKLAEREKEVYTGKKERLKRAFEAGVEAYKEDKTGALQA